MSTEYKKLRTKVFGIIEGLTLSDEKYFELRKLLSYAEKIHCGTRKDGSPEFSHQLQMLALAINFHKMLNDPFNVYMAIVSHDLIEDYPHTRDYLYTNFPCTENYSTKLAKYKDINDSNEKTYNSYFNTLSECEVCSVVKLIDRVHNLSTAPGVFSTEKINEYCNEVQIYFYDMINKAKTQFNQREVYEILKFMLTTQTSTIQALV